MNRNNKKGTAIVEAAMILPLVIAAVIAVICIIINMYLSLSLQASQHVALRMECGVTSQTVFRQETKADYQWSSGKAGIRPVILMEAVREYRINSLFQNHTIKKIESRSYVIDEADLIRIFSYDREEP